MNTGEKGRGTSVLVTGAGGYIGRALIQALAGSTERIGAVTALDVRPVKDTDQTAGVKYEEADIRSPDLAEVVGRHQPDVVVHLAAVVTPGRKSDREFEYSVDVLGTKNLLEACLAAGVGKVIVTSSGAAYGYHPDSSEWLDEMDPLRGNVEFAYSDHKRQVEEMLATWRVEHPDLKQIVFRPGTILGETAANQITDLFAKPWVLGLAGVDSPFVIIWDQDVVGAILCGVTGDRTGIFNLAGDGVLTLKEMAAIMKKPYLPKIYTRAAHALAESRLIRCHEYHDLMMAELNDYDLCEHFGLLAVFSYFISTVVDPDFFKELRHLETERLPRLRSEIDSLPQNSRARASVALADAERFCCELRREANGEM